ncbi:MAG: GNAT family N-acetyltransferase [Candidatus Kapabacteria bacterium]|jgi:RimJ/RimL family protein N-acetyltransferase|nr:GNAT family N-acetyltransferase [Candidatus Kapabacteria bacterium]
MLEPITLEGNYVRLEPLSMRHLDDLCEVGLNPALWRMAGRAMTKREDIQAYIEEAFLPETAGVALPFATIDKASGKAVGSTRFGNVALAHKRMEIGWTWIGKPYQRTRINTEAKLLMLTHGFETLGMNRMELKANAKNDQSRRAMERLGAKYEGVLRRHTILPNGTVRDTVYYSIVRDEWAAVKAGLEAALQHEYEVETVADDDDNDEKITVHRADSRHLELLLPLFDGYRQFYEQPSNLEAEEAFLRERILKQESVIFVALVGNKGAGFTQLYPSFSSVTMQRQWILNDLFVEPEFRKLGVADAIMQTAEEFSYADNAKGLVLSTAVDNLPAQTLYEKRGWKRDTAFYTYEKYFVQS